VLSYLLLVCREPGLDASLLSPKRGEKLRQFQGRCIMVGNPFVLVGRPCVVLGEGLVIRFLIEHNIVSLAVKGGFFSLLFVELVMQDGSLCEKPIEIGFSGFDG
jgi:hypothetical protein